MSGHSKWANIKRKKGVEDAKRGQLFTKLARDITIAAREGGKDVNANPSLRTAVEKARENNMPKANIDRAIARGVGELDGVSYEEAVYEGYGPLGIAFYIKCLTDNRNRTVAEIRNVFNRHGGSLGEAGSVSYLFSTDLENPSFTIPITDEAANSKFNSIMEDLEELDDIVAIYHNAQIS
jgi:YebC/PmpR family DNA-binding regulatory protein